MAGTNDYIDAMTGDKARMVYVVLLVILVLLALVSMYYTNTNLGLWKGVVDNGVDRYNLDKSHFVGAAGAGSAMAALSDNSHLGFGNYPGARSKVSQFRSKKPFAVPTGANLSDAGHVPDIIAANAADDYASLLATTTYTGAQVDDGMYIW
jgi:hypothetical protein